MDRSCRLLSCPNRQRSQLPWARQVALALHLPPSFCRTLEADAHLPHLNFKFRPDARKTSETFASCSALPCGTGLAITSQPAFLLGFEL